MTVRRPTRTRRWSVADARANLPDVFAAAAREPQAVYRHDEPVGVVVSPRDFALLDAERRARDGQTLADAFAALRQLEAGPLAVPPRRDRANAFNTIRRRRVG
jgi:PHD/YefM family antitoxin component YafN of YafNO toxin-antitoxin module